MVYAEHHFSLDDIQITTSMHRRAGSQRESVHGRDRWRAVCRSTDMREWHQEKAGGVRDRSDPRLAKHP